MLRKVLKHDLRASLKTWIILNSVLLALGFVIGLCIRGIETVNSGVIIQSNLSAAILTTFSIMGIVISFFGMSGCILGVYITLIYRYYKNFFTDEGYLTFTLPVKRSTLLNGKLISAFIYEGATVAVFFLSLFIALLFIPGKTHSTMIGDIGASLSSLLAGISFTGADIAFIIGYAIGIILILISSFALSLLMTHACVTIGCIIAKKHKLLASIAAYYVMGMAFSALYYMTYIPIMIFAEASMGGAFIELSKTQEMTLILVIILGVAAFLTVSSALVYKFILGRLRRNLNLA